MVREDEIQWGGGVRTKSSVQRVGNLLVRGEKFSGERGRNPVIREDKIQWGMREGSSVQRGMKSIR